MPAYAVKHSNAFLRSCLKMFLKQTVVAKRATV